MEFEWDEGKDAANRAKHGVSLAEAVGLDWVGGERVIDSRRNYGEQRAIHYASLAGRLHVCAFTQRGDKIRIISLRKANERERMAHGI